MKINWSAVLALSISITACGGGSSTPTEPAAPTATPLPTATPVPTPTLPPFTPTPTPLPAAPIQGFVSSPHTVSTLAIGIVVTQGLKAWVTSADAGGFYRVDGPVAGPAQIVASPGHGCADVILNVQLHAATNEINIQICP